MLAEDPESADVILFVGSRDPLNSDIRRHALARRLPARSVLYDSNDRVIPFLRGIYPSIDRRDYDPARVRSSFYLRNAAATAITFTDPDKTPRYLYGFVGASCTHPIRSRLFALKSGAALLRDTTHDVGRGFGQQADVYDRYKAAYASELAAVRFVLCPRGVGTGSMRLFEAMRAGRAPVILSDGWVEMPGPCWERFSIRVAEKDAERLPEILSREEGRASTMGTIARAEWERWCSPDSAFQVLSGMASDLVDGDFVRERRAQVAAHCKVLRWRTLRYHVLGPSIRKWMRLP